MNLVNKIYNLFKGVFCGYWMFPEQQMNRQVFKTLYISDSLFLDFFQKFRTPNATVIASKNWPQMAGFSLSPNYQFNNFPVFFPTDFSLQLQHGPGECPNQ